MLRLLRSRKAQNTAEYAILIALVIGVFSAMQIYVRRGLQARIKGGADTLPYAVLGQANTIDGVGEDILGDRDMTQYEPYYITKGVYNMRSTTNEGLERGINDDTGGKSVVGQVFTLLDNLGTGPEHGYPQPDNHAATDYAQHQLGDVDIVLGNLLESEIN